MDTPLGDLMTYNNTIQNKLKGLMYFLSHLKGQQVPRRIKQTLQQAVAAHKLIETRITKLYQ